MELIERYLQAIGRALPEQQRADILTELRSSLYDALAESDDPKAEAAQAAALIQQMGPPQQVAAAYYPAGQYLVGPPLYPLFRTVLGIVFTIVIAIQLFQASAGLLLNSWAEALVDSTYDIIASLTTALGFVVLIFWGLQQMDVKANQPEDFDPHALPPLEADADHVSRGNQIFSIIVNLVVFTLLARFAQQGGFTWIDGRGFFENAVISRYLPVIVLASLAEIVLDIVLMWQGRWWIATRLVSVAINVGSFALALFLLWQHDLWLATHGIGGILTGFGDIPALISERSPLLGLVLVRAILVFSLPVLAVEAGTAIYHCIRAMRRG
ncbi:MAG: hypothetical protein KF832_26055 [Caldilineaceae bacterium]|nr:hypothetical protein [Caldilineaceae bacterium]